MKSRPAFTPTAVWGSSRYPNLLIAEIVETVYSSFTVLELKSTKTFCLQAASNSKCPVTPNDCETRTFLHDLPVAADLTAEAIAPLLRHRKSVIVKDQGVVTYGTVSLEQAFIIFSSVCFACFVKFFSDILNEKKAGSLGTEKESIFHAVVDLLPDPPAFQSCLMTGPFDNDKQVLQFR